MPRVASEASIYHTQRHDQGLRSRSATADDGQPSSPFATLVETTTPPATDHRGTTPPTRKSSTDDTRTNPRSPQTSDQPKSDDQTDATAASGTPADAATDATRTESGEPAAVTSPGEDDKPAQTDAAGAALLLAAAVDARAAQPATEPQPQAAPVTAETTLAAAETPSDQGGDSVAQAATSGETLKASVPAIKTAGAIGQKGTTAPKIGAVGAAAATAPQELSAANSEDADQVGAPAEQHVATQGQTESAPQDKARIAHGPAGPQSHADSQKLDDVANQSAALQPGDTTHSAKTSSEPLQVMLQTNDRVGTAAAPAANSQPQSDAPLVSVAGLAVEIAARAQSGRSRFEIRLDPPELGRIDVRLDVDSNGQVTSRLTVERTDTLEHLRRDAAGLERALQDAGLKTADNGLQFALRDQSFAGRDDNGSSPNAARLVVPDPDLAPVDLQQSAYSGLTRAGGGIDIRV